MTQTIVAMARGSAYGRAACYVLASAGLCLAGAWAGLSVARHWSA